MLVPARTGEVSVHKMLDWLLAAQLFFGETSPQTPVEEPKSEYCDDWDCLKAGCCEGQPKAPKGYKFKYHIQE
eukprot:g46987.t1